MQEKITLKLSQYNPNTHFIITEQRLKTPEKNMPLHQNPSPSYYICI